MHNWLLSSLLFSYIIIANNNQVVAVAEINSIQSVGNVRHTGLYLVCYACSSISINYNSNPISIAS